MRSCVALSRTGLAGQRRKAAWNGGRIHLPSGQFRRQHGVMAERFDVSRDGIILAGERWPGGGPTVLLLHEGVADRRGWAEVAGLLAPELTVVAYDRRGYGQTPPSTGPFSHLDDLLAVLDHAGAGPVWLAGASAGGGLALDAALAAPGRVAGLVVMGTAVSGAPEPGLDTATRRLEPLLDEAYAARDAREINRLETWLWLDGPAQPEGRVSGAARKLALDMNAVIIGNGVPETEGAADVDAWHRLAEIKVPVTVACGDLDVPFLVDRCRLLAARLPAARHRVLAGMAHQPYLESAGTVAQLIRTAVTEG
jgi:pimeloyl-ACP methyl ester carboxylesterase